MKWFCWRLPCDAEPIQAEWPIKEGGVRAYAWTDAKGSPYLCLKTLNRIGKITGSPDWLKRRRFRSDMVVGFVDEKPLVMDVRAKVTKGGLELIVLLPSNIKTIRGFIEKRFTPWGSETPSFSIAVRPTKDYYAIRSFPYRYCSLFKSRNNEPSD